MYVYLTFLKFVNQTHPTAYILDYRQYFHSIIYFIIIIICVCELDAQTLLAFSALQLRHSLVTELVTNFKVDINRKTRTHQEPNNFSFSLSIAISLLLLLILNLAFSLRLRTHFLYNYILVYKLAYS